MGDKRRLLEDELGNEFNAIKNDYIGHSTEAVTTGMDTDLEPEDEPPA